MDISVIIPTYKPQNYLWECLDSLYNQTLDKDRYEIILVLNGCKEPYFSDIAKWLKQHSEMSVNFIQTDMGGVSNARNIALDTAKGNYITFIDDDDYVSTKFLEGLLQSAGKDTVALSNAIAFNDKINEQVKYGVTDEYKKHVGKRQVKFTKVRKYFSGPWMKLYHRNMIGERRFNTRFKNGEDSLFVFLISDRCKYCKCADEDSVYYRRYRENSAISNGHKLRNVYNMMIEYTRIYFSGKYSFGFYLSRIMGAIHMIINI